MKSSILAILAVTYTVLAAPPLRKERSPVDGDSMTFVRTTNSAGDNGYGPDYAKYKTYGDYKRGVDDGGYGQYDKYEDYGKYGKYADYGKYGKYD